MKTLLLLPFLLIFSCSTVAPFLVSDEDEKKIGSEYNSILQDSLSVLSPNDTRAVFIDTLGHHLAQYQDRANFTTNDFHFYVIDDTVINAFALPGGYIYVYTGLLNKTETVDQVAGVLAHEIGHVAAMHYKEQVIKINGLNFLASLVAGKSTAGDIALNLGMFLTQMKMSRNNEYQADSLSIAYTSESEQYSPWGMKDFLDTLNSLFDDGHDPEIFKTHPNSDNRAEKVEELITGEYKNSASIKDDKPLPF